jgi:hypothetical protein
VHRISAQHNALGAAAINFARGVLQNPGRIIPEIIMLGMLDGSEINAKEDQWRGSQSAETATNRLVDNPIVFRR